MIQRIRRAIVVSLAIFAFTMLEIVFFVLPNTGNNSAAIDRVIEAPVAKVAYTCTWDTMTAKDFDYNEVFLTEFYTRFKTVTHYKHCVSPINHYDIVTRTVASVTELKSKSCDGRTGYDINPGTLSGQNLVTHHWGCNPGQQTYWHTYYWNDMYVHTSNPDRCMGFDWRIYNNGIIKDTTGTAPVACLG